MSPWNCTWAHSRLHVDRDLSELLGCHRRYVPFVLSEVTRYLLDEPGASWVIHFSTRL